MPPGDRCSDVSGNPASKSPACCGTGLPLKAIGGSKLQGWSNDIQRAPCVHIAYLMCHPVQQTPPQLNKKAHVLCLGYETWIFFEQRKETWTSTM